LTGVSAIVVSWNTRELTAGCLRNLIEHAPQGADYEIVLVDNGSTDGTIEVVEREWPEVQLIPNTENVGFTRANNQGILVSRGNYLLLINTDARLTDGCFDHMLRVIETKDRVGAVGPRLVYGDGRWQRWTAGRAPTFWTALNYYLFLDRLSQFLPALRGIYAACDTRRGSEVDWVCSACMLLSRAALDEVGLLDEGIFVYMDDVELCQRLRDGGWRVWYSPEVDAIHFGGHNRITDEGIVSTVALRAFNQYFARRNGRRAAFGLGIVQTIGHSLRALLYAAAAALRRGDPNLVAQARAHAAFSQFGLSSAVGHARKG